MGICGSKEGVRGEEFLQLPTPNCKDFHFLFSLARKTKFLRHNMDHLATDGDINNRSSSTGNYH